MNHVELIVERTNAAAKLYGYTTREDGWPSLAFILVLLAADAFGNIELAEKEEYECYSV